MAMRGVVPRRGRVRWLASSCVGPRVSFYFPTSFYITRWRPGGNVCRLVGLQTRRQHVRFPRCKCLLGSPCPGQAAHCSRPFEPSPRSTPHVASPGTVARVHSTHLCTVLGSRSAAAWEALCCYFARLFGALVRLFDVTVRTPSTSAFGSKKSNAFRLQNGVFAYAHRAALRGAVSGPRLTR